MTEREINEIVRLTVKETVIELRRNGLLKRQDDVAYSEISGRLFDYYKAPETDKKLGAAVRRIMRDPYFEIIPRYYGNRVNMDSLAEMFGCEVSTISRNKKRLALRLYMDTRE